MNWKQSLCTGAATGAILATFVALIMLKIGIEPPSLAAALAIFNAMVLVSAFSVKKISQQIGFCDPSLKQLIPVAFLTFFLPLLGASFGAPNSDLDTLVLVILLGTAGGFFWSIPFTIWTSFRAKKLKAKKIQQIDDIVSGLEGLRKY